VIRVGVRQDDRVDRSDPFVPEEGGDDIAAHVETVVVGAAPVDEHPFSARKFDEGTTGMAHIEEGDTKGVPVLQFPVKPRGIAGEENQSQSHDGKRLSPGAEERNLRRGAAGQTQQQGRCDQQDIVGRKFRYGGRRDDRGAPGRAASQSLRSRHRRVSHAGNVDE